MAKLTKRQVADLEDILSPLVWAESCLTHCIIHPRQDDVTSCAEALISVIEAKNLIRTQVGKR